MKKFMMAAFVALLSMSACDLFAQAPQKEIYEWRVYYTINVGRLDRYMQDVVIPTYNKHGISIGAYGEYSMNQPTIQYYLFVYPDMAAYQRVNTTLKNDKEYWEKAGVSNGLNPCYSRYDTYLLEAFDCWPKVSKTDRGLLELRIYESNDNDANRRKVKMFNDGEVPIFIESGINPYMFGDIIAGPNMPALMYLTSYEDMKTRDAAWDKFRVQPKWVEMKAKPEYANTATKIHRRFLVPLSYSQY